MEEIKNYVSNDIKDLTFQPVVRYGDSIIGESPLLLRNTKNGNIFLQTIEMLGNKYIMMDNRDKESSEIDDIETWTEKGWTKIHRVIRHKLPKDKLLFRITTNSGSVIVTDDHSLLTQEGKEISPKDINLGDKLLHSFPEFKEIPSFIKNLKFYQDNICKDMMDAMKLYILGKSLGYNVLVSTYSDNYIITFTNEKKSNMDNIIKIEPWLSKEKYVYDLTTDNHHFQAGIGSMIVHNTDSIFSCYRFRENTVKVDNTNSLKIFNKTIQYAYKLIEPFFADDYQKSIFKNLFDEHYNEPQLLLELPPPPICAPESKTNMVLLNVEERIRHFLKEYIQESYFPWLWTLVELVEKNHIEMFDIKLFKWANHLLSKHHLAYNDLYEKRTSYLIEPLLKYIDNIYNNNYTQLTAEAIDNMIDYLKTLEYKDEIIVDNKKLYNSIKILLNKTIKEKWIYSNEKKEIIKIINTFLDNVIIKDENSKINYDKIYYYLIDFITENKNFDINKTTELLIINLENNMDMGFNFDKNNLQLLTKNFIETYTKNVGKKTMNEIISEFIVKDLNLSFDKYKNEIIDNLITFINNTLRYENMIDIEKNDYTYYWLQPKWLFDENNNKKYCMDIYEGGQAITDQRTLTFGMKMGELSGELIKSRLPFPHVLEYEKTFWPFAILSKKRYVGNKYEFNPNKYKQDFMGIVLKRRDNAAIVKEICGGIVDYLINKRSPDGAKRFTNDCLQNMFDGKYDIKYFLQSKTLKLKESYKDWKKIAHVYLSEKIAQRDPGNVPQSGDRIEYAVIKVPIPKDGTKLLQGDIIETPKFIKENNLEIDYLFYLTNQIMNPALQFLELVDKNAIDIFNHFINKYSQPKIKKEKVVKEKVVKQKVVKEKVVKNKKKTTNKSILEKMKELEAKSTNIVLKELLEQTKKLSLNWGTSIDLMGMLMNIRNENKNNKLIDDIYESIDNFQLEHCNNDKLINNIFM
jgi:hypothetical protein